jgi:hypothetical protein
MQYYTQQFIRITFPLKYKMYTIKTVSFFRGIKKKEGKERRNEKKNKKENNKNSCC